MTDRKDGGDKSNKDIPSDDELDALVGRAFAKRGELVPTSEDEVRDAEDDDISFDGELPAELATFRAPETASASEEPGAPPSAVGVASQRVVSLDDARARKKEGAAATSRPSRSSGLSHFAAALIGAAAAAALFLMQTGTETSPVRPVDSAAGGIPSATPTAGPIEIGAVTSCADECCAGASCEKATGELKQCSSGRSCIGCEQGVLSAGVYRVRVGHFFPSDELTTKQAENLDLCARTGGQAWWCTPAYAAEDTKKEWRYLPTRATREHAAAGIEMELRFRDTQTAVAKWHQSVRITPTVLCMGVGVGLNDEKAKTLGSLSLFFDDAHYVEVARAEDIKPLGALGAEFAFEDVKAELYETSKAGAAHFALVVGPLDKPAAERLRRQLFEAGQSPVVTMGADFVGNPMPLPSPNPR